MISWLKVKIVYSLTSEVDENHPSLLFGNDETIFIVYYETKNRVISFLKVGKGDN